jgi:hypothetical protein
MLELKCMECGVTTSIPEAEINAKLSPIHPALSVVITCKCGMGQWVIESRKVKHDSGRQ